MIPLFGEDAIKCEQLQLTTSAARILREEAHRFRRSLRECKERIHEGTAERAHAHPESFEERHDSLFSKDTRAFRPFCRKFGFRRDQLLRKVGGFERARNKDSNFVATVISC